jgi:hypothetical protein
MLTTHLTKDGSMFENHQNPSSIRRGRFLWLPEPARKDYLKALREKIANGFFTTDSILAQIVDELAPLYADSAAHE